MNDIPQLQPQYPQKQYRFYRILGFINNFMSVFFLFLTLMSFAAAGFQPRLLLYLFIFLAIMVYTNLTAVFARHVMVKGNYLRLRLKDWIKVNAIVAILFAGFMIISIIFILIDKTFIQKVVDMYSQVEGMSKDTFVSMLKGVMVFFGTCMVILIIHIIMTFRYLNRFSAYFKNEADRPV